jgi:AraC-like DNA-binding protein
MDCVSAQQNLTARKWAFETSLLSLVPHVPPTDPVVHASIHWLAQHRHGRVRQLSRWIGISSRQLQSRFSASVGYGPKAFQAIRRFQQLLHCSASRTHRWSLAELAADVGYADQAHMTREVLRLSGCSPTVMFPSAKCAPQMSDFFKTPPDGAA